MQTVIQIVPALPPTVNGVGDYGWAISTAMRNQCGVGTQFIVANHSKQDETCLPDNAASAGDRSELTSLLLQFIGQGGDQPLLLQYSGYGYQPRGIPVGLVRALEAVRRERRNLRLVVMFHELYAFGPPWRSSFWLSPIQRRLARRLTLLADAVLTNCFTIKGALQSWTDKKIDILAVPSTVGEPIVPPGLPSSRPGVAVIFGQVQNRQRTHNQVPSIMRQLRNFGIEEIWDIGPSPEEIRATSEMRVKFLGKQSVEDIGTILQQCRMGVLAYPLHCLTRSTVFAALAAHGTPVLVCPVEASEPAGISEKVHFLSGQGTDLPDISRLDEIGNNVCAWYADHSLEIQAKQQLLSLFPQ